MNQRTNMKELSHDELARIEGGINIIQAIIGIGMYLISAVRAGGNAPQDPLQYDGGQLDLPHSKNGIALV